MALAIIGSVMIIIIVHVTFPFVQHWFIQRKRFKQQVAEDTCDKHSVFCCAQCFDMRPTTTIKPDWMHDHIGIWESEGGAIGQDRA